MTRNEFNFEFAGLCEMYDKEPSKGLTEIYFRALNVLTKEELGRAVGHIVANRKYTKLPLPAEFLSFIHGDPEQKAIIALDNLECAVRAIGSYNTIVFDDPVIHKVVSTVTEQWIGVCNMTLNEWVWFRKDFLKLYQAFAANINDMNVPLELVGRIDQQNNINGYHDVPRAIAYFGDRKKIEAWQSQRKQIEGKNARILKIAEGIIKQMPDGKNQ